VALQEKELSTVNAVTGRGLQRHKRPQGLKQKPLIQLTDHAITDRANVVTDLDAHVLFRKMSVHL
jgi:hypothetical protein